MKKAKEIIMCLNLMRYAVTINDRESFRSYLEDLNYLMTEVMPE